MMKDAYRHKYYVPKSIFGNLLQSKYVCDSHATTRELILNHHLWFLSVNNGNHHNFLNGKAMFSVVMAF